MNYTRAKRRAITKLVVLDYLVAVAGWIIFWLFRQHLLHQMNPTWEPGIRPFASRDFIFSLAAVPVFWLFLHYLAGTYFDPYRKSRLQELYRTLIATLLGVLIIGLTAFANDLDSFKYFWKITSLYFVVQFTLSFIARTVYYGYLKIAIARHQYVYPVLIVGSNGKATQVYQELMKSPNANQYSVIGYLPATQESALSPTIPLTRLGQYSDLAKVVEEHRVAEVLIALESREHKLLEPLLIQLSYEGVHIKILPDLFDFLSGGIKTTNVYDPIFVNISPELLPDWQKVCKRMLDIGLSTLAILLLSPIYLLCAIMVRTGSSGQTLYRQERVGLLGKPFNILKFRSMYPNAEAAGPLLSKTNDPRITRWGRTMRKWRLDELPQFFNILRGDMSLVGPRPERAHYINQIIETHPHYRYLHRVKPGLTSWGMVKYGYAESVDQMIERMRYDLLYIENCSILLDFKIMVYTFLVLAQGRGK